MACLTVHAWLASTARLISSPTASRTARTRAMSRANGSSPTRTLRMRKPCATYACAWAAASSAGP